MSIWNRKAVASKKEMSSNAKTESPAVMGSPIQVTGAKAGYGRTHILHDLDLHVPAGSVTALLGINGVGKSTLLKLLTGELRAVAGEVRVLGHDPRRETRALLQKIGYVPDRIELPKWMRIQDHMRFLAPLYPTWADAEATRLLDLFGLDKKLRYRDLSRGQRVLENLVMALAHKPKLLLLDEPFAGLDPLSRRRVIDGVFEHLGETAGEADARPAVLFASHGLQDIERCADRIALLNGGTCVLNSSLEELQQSSARLLVRRNTDEPWTPPGSPHLESAGVAGAAATARRETVLFYADLSCEARTSLLDALKARPDVESVVELDRDLEDLFLSIDAKAKDLGATLTSPQGEPRELVGVAQANTGRASGLHQAPSATSNSSDIERPNDSDGAGQ
jgi:ABC-2 type transport system ATP-binding protein